VLVCYVNANMFALVTQADIASALERLYVWPCQDIHQLLTMLDMMYTTGCVSQTKASIYIDAHLA
jgi:hypothetical protein